MPDQWFEIFNPATSDGILPNDVPSRAFRYRKSLIWQIDLNSLGISGGEKRFTWTVTVAAPDGSGLFFQQTVVLVLFLVSLGVPGLELFTWNYVRDTFNTSVVAATVVSPANISLFLQGGTAASEQGDMQPASGQGSTNQTATIIADWYSPIYVFDNGQPLPPGYKFTKSRDTGGIGNLQSTYGWAFDEGKGGHSYLDRHGAIRSLETQGNRAYLAHTYDGPNSRLVRDSLPGVSNATVFKSVTGRLYVMGSIQNEYRVWYSTNEGIELLPLLYTRQTAPPGTDLGGKQVSLWTGAWKNVSPPAISKRGIAQCAMLGSDLYFQFSRSISSPGNIVKVGPHNNRPCFVLLEETAGGGAGIILTDNVDLQYEGDGLNDWKRIP